MSYKNKTILVTASAKRLGKYIVTDLVKAGWDIAIHYKESKLLAEETAHDLTKIGGRVSLYQADLSNQSEIEKLINNVKKLNSKWTGLINNAGFFNYDNGTSFDFNNLNNHMAVNFMAPAMLTQALAKFILECQKEDKSLQGVVINILDAKIFGLNPDYYSYTLSKQAMYGLTKMSALSYASAIRVNGIAPGITLPAPGQDQKSFEISHKQNLLKSSSTVEEVLNAIQFLIKSKSITGHVTLLDGGAHLAPPRRDVGLQLYFYNGKIMLKHRKRKIFINNLQLMASVGAYDDEKKHKQKIIVDMEIYLTNQSETQKDELYDTQDYSQFRKIVHDIVNSKHFQLLEILTNKVHLEIIQNEFVIGAKIKITKPDIFSDCEVSYELSNI